MIKLCVELCVMQESWINLVCNACEAGWETKISEVPEDNGRMRCNSCGNEARVKEFLRSDRDLEIYEEFN